MKTCSRFMLLGFLVFAHSALAEDTALRLQPTDFAAGIHIGTVGDAPFYRFELPPETYVGTAYPDMRDLRVFNRAGEPLPFALLAPPAPAAQTANAPLQLFRLDDKPINAGKNSVVVTSRNESVEVQLDRTSDGRNKVSYLLELRGISPAPNLSHIELDWGDMPEAWQDTATVMGSSDLKNWTVVANGLPVMDLRANGERLRVAELKFEPYVRRAWQYWRVSFATGNAAPLRGATAHYDLQASTVTPIRIDTAANASSDREAVYQLPAPQPVHGLSITPAQNNAVIPLEVEYRSASDQTWKPLSKTVAYKINDYQDETGTPLVSLHGELVQAIRLRAISAGWGNAAPQVQALRQPRVLVFNARGGGPYLLAWGARAAQDEALPLSKLIPNVRDFADLDKMPLAYSGGSVTLGGPERLTALAPAERAGLWQKGLLWAVLVIGALGLLSLAFKLWREMKSQ